MEKLPNHPEKPGSGNPNKQESAAGPEQRTNPEQAKPLQQGLSFRRGQVQNNWRSVLRRNAANVVMEKTGNSSCNAGMMAALDAMARSQGLDPSHYTVAWGVNEEKGIISLYPSRPDAADTLPVIREGKGKGGGRASIHLGPALMDAPTLRPAMRSRCVAAPSVDQNGDPCVVIILSAASEMPVQPRKKKSGGNDAQPNSKSS